MAFMVDMILASKALLLFNQQGPAAVNGTVI
jgi:hypothetical protein